MVKASLEQLRTLIRTATSSMTSVPKPLKFLRPHYGDLVKLHSDFPAGENKKFFANVLSVLAMTYYEPGKRDSLKYRLQGKQDDPVGDWGHEYVKHLSGEIMAEYEVRTTKDSQEATDDIMKLALEIVPFFLTHNAEPDACDLLMELEALDKLAPLVDKNNFERICYYIVSCVSYMPPPDDLLILKTAHGIYRQMKKLPQALQLALRMNDAQLIKEDFDLCTDPLEKKQLAFLLARQQYRLETTDDSLDEILTNSKLSHHFKALGRDLDVVEAKTPEDIYKKHLENSRSGFGVTVDSARQNLASTYVNAFVNAGFCSDKLIMGAEDNSSNWVYKNKDHGMLAASASVGMLNMWDVDEGLTQIDKYLYADDDFVKAGGLLAIGLANCGVKSDSDPALALLSEQLDGKVASMRAAAIFGLGLAYANSDRSDVSELLLPLISDTGLSMELASLAAFACGLVHIGSCEGQVTSTILQTMMERDETMLKDPHARFMALGLGLLYLSKQEESEAVLETLKVIEHPLGRMAEVLVEVLAYAGTGNVLKIQHLLQLCTDHLDAEKEDNKFQAIAVIGIALIAMGEDIGAEMATRTLNHLMHYGEHGIRQAVPLAFGLLCASNPLVNVLDILSKYSHDNDIDVAMNAIFGMGLVGAGTNNARLAQMLRQLAAYYQKEPNALFVVRIAQGLIHMGKGTMTLNPYHSNRTLLSPSGVAGLVASLLLFTDSKSLVLAKSHYLLYSLALAMYPRFLITLDEKLEPVVTTVRVGQAVEVVGQAGKPKTITGFQTHSTPVLLGFTERAELGTEEYLPVTPILEGFVILRKNPEWEDDKELK